MFRHLMSYGVTSLVLGFATVSPFPSTLSAVVTGICAVALAATVIRAPAPRRRLALALMILAVACYAVPVYVIFFPSNVADGHRVYFTERNSAVVDAARKGRRTADLIVWVEETGGA